MYSLPLSPEDPAAENPLSCAATGAGIAVVNKKKINKKATGDFIFLIIPRRYLFSSQIGYRPFPPFSLLEIKRPFLTGEFHQSIMKTTAALASRSVPATAWRKRVAASLPRTISVASPPLLLTASAALISKGFSPTRGMASPFSREREYATMVEKSARSTLTMVGPYNK